MEKLLSVDDLHAGYGPQEAVHGVSLAVEPGETLAVAGESGSGKSTLLRALLGIDPAIWVKGAVCWQGEDIASWPYARRRELCGREIGFIPQNPGASFHPVRTYDSQLREMLRCHNIYHKEQFYEQIQEIFEKLELHDWQRILKSRPYEMSGGMNQRIAIAAAMLLRPKLLLADEPTSALDVTIQKQVAELLMELRRHWGVSLILVTHNLGLAAMLSDRLAIMRSGTLLEYGKTAEVLRHPQSDYTRLLLDSVPQLPKEG